jgi:hypothetical protein
MARQIGLVLGVSVFIAVVGTPHGYAAVHDAFESAWWAIVGVAGLAAVTAFGMTPRRIGTDVPSIAAVPVAAEG